MTTLAEIRRDLGASGVADAIRRALAAHDTVTAAAESLGTSARALRLAAQRTGVEWAERPRTPGTAAKKKQRKRRVIATK